MRSNGSRGSNRKAIHSSVVRARGSTAVRSRITLSEVAGMIGSDRLANAGEIDVDPRQGRQQGILNRPGVGRGRISDGDFLVAGGRLFAVRALAARQWPASPF